MLSLALSLAGSNVFGALAVTSRDEGLNDAQWTKPRIFVQNTGANPEVLHALRYFFTPTAGKTPEVSIWDPGSATATIVHETSTRAYVQIDLGDVTLQPGESLRWGNGVLFGLHNADWSTWTKSDDYSAVAVSEGVVSNPRVVIVDSTGTQGDDGSANNCWENYAVIGQNGVDAGDRANVNGNIQSNAILNIGYDAVVSGNAYSLGNLLVRDRAKISKDALAGALLTLGYGVTVSGAAIASSNQVPACNVGLPSTALTLGDMNIDVANGATRTLAPGSYGALVVGYGSTLVLSAGEYTFSSFKVLADGKLRLTAGRETVKLLVQGAFEFGDRSTVLFDGEELPRRLQVIAYGSQQSTIGYDAVLKGTLAAPAANVFLRSRSFVKGGIAASTVTVEADAKVEWSQTVVPVNQAPVVIVYPWVVPYAWGGTLKPENFQIIDADTPLDQIVFTITSLSHKGVLYKEGWFLFIGDSFTWYDIEMQRISWEQRMVADFDTFTLDVSDGVNHVPVQVTIEIGDPILTSN